MGLSCGVPTKTQLAKKKKKKKKPARTRQCPMRGSCDFSQ